MNIRKRIELVLLMMMVLAATISCQLAAQVPQALSPMSTLSSPLGESSQAVNSPKETSEVVLPLITKNHPPATPAPTSEPTQPPEQPVIPIPLTGPVAEAEAQVSGLAWYGENLVLLPQYPQRMSDSGEPGLLFALTETRILSFLDGEDPEPLLPEPVPFASPNFQDLITEFEGFEAIAFAGERVFLTIESGGDGPMMSYLVGGVVTPGLGSIQIDTSTLTRIPPQSDLNNRGEESLVAAKDHLLTIYETNGAEIVSEPVAHQIDFENLEITTLPFPNIEYRITDASQVDPKGRFWVLNTFFPADLAVFPDSDPIADQYGRGATHANQLSVERLLELQASPERVALTGRPPIQLQLPEGLEFRNFEGLEVLPGRGFLLVTDQYPATLLAFVPFP